MYNDLLELPQRVIATARIGVRPELRDIETASSQLIAARTELQRRGRSALDLEPARVAIAVLRLGHMPHRNACIGAVAALADVMTDPEPLDGDV